jgi:hypothetical protein
LYIFIISFYFDFLEYDVTIIDSVKENAITDAYMKLYETLYRHRKIPGYVFRKKEGVAAAVFHHPPAVTTTFVAGVEFSSADIRYRNRPVQGYQVIFDGTAAQPLAESKEEYLVGEENKKIEIEEQRKLEIEKEKKQVEIEEKRKLEIEKEIKKGSNGRTKETI